MKGLGVIRVSKVVFSFLTWRKIVHTSLSLKVHCKLRHWSSCLHWKLPSPPPRLHTKMSSPSADYSVKGDSGVIKPGSAEGGQDVAQKSKGNNGVTAFIHLARAYLPSPWLALEPEAFPS